MKKFFPGREAALHDVDNTAIMKALNAATGADAADLLETLNDAAAAGALEHLPLQRRASVFGYLPLSRQASLIASMPCPAAKALFSALPDDEQADLYNRLSPGLRENLLRSLGSEDSGDLLKLTQYPEGSAGSVATTDFVAATAGMTAAQAVVALQQQARDIETVYILYVLDAEERLQGTVSLRELILAAPEELMGDIMRPDPVVIAADKPGKQAVDDIQRYDLLALPVMDDQGRMIGVITVDDAMDVAEAEDASNLVRFGGSKLNTTELDMLTTPLSRMFSARFFWLAVLTLFGVLTSNLVAGQEELLSEVIILAAFLAPIIDMGGNTGSQSATLVIRAMALGQVKLCLKDVWFVIKRDVPVALMLGVSIALLEAVLAYFSKGVGMDILLIVGLSMLTVTIVGSLIGLLLPFAAKRIGTDPATLSSPLITSVMDLLGVLIYFGFAYIFLGNLLA